MISLFHATGKKKTESGNQGNNDIFRFHKILPIN